MVMRRCSKCREEKTPEHFYKRVRRGVNGDIQYASECRRCRSDYERKRYRYRRPRVPPGEKLCPHCQKILPKHQFGINRTVPCGVQAYCLDCWKVRSKMWYEAKRRREGKN
jgi:hypothetical protein